MTAINLTMLDTPNRGNQSSNINQLTPDWVNIAYQVNDSLLAGNNVSSTYTNQPINVALNYGITGNQSDKISSGYLANVSAQHSAKLFAQQLAKTLADVSAKIYANQSPKFTGNQSGEHFSGYKSADILHYPNSDISKRGEFTPLAKGDFSHLIQGLIWVTTLGRIEFLQSIKGRVIEFCQSIKKGSYLATQFCQSSDCLVLRCRRLISAFADVTKKPAVLSPSCFNFSISSITSCGMRTVVICDFAFFTLLAITATPFLWCILVYAKIMRLKGLKCISLDGNLKCKGEIHLRKQNPVDAENTYRVSNHNVIRGNTMAMYKSTQTHPKFLWRFDKCHENKAIYHHVTAHAKDEASSQLPNLLFALGGEPCLR